MRSNAVYNFITGSFDYIDTTSLSTNELKAYIPQDVSALGIFGCYVELGVPTSKAYLATLLQYAGQKDEADSVVAEYLSER